MKVLVLHNAVDAAADEAERDVLVQVAAVSEALTELGHQVQFQALDLNLETLAKHLQRQPVDLVFNLVESLAGTDRLQVLPALLLDAMGTAYTGSSPGALLLTGDKPQAKRLLRSRKLPTPDWIEEVPPRPLRKRAAGCAGPGRKAKSPQSAAAARPRRFLVKACWEHASLQLEEETALLVEDDVAAIRRQLEARRQQTGRPWFAEQYIEGREFNLSLLGGGRGPEVLPIAEIDFSAFPPGRLPIVGYRAKWDADSFEYHATPRRFEFPAGDRPLLRRLKKLALTCWQLFGLRGYARVDFRVDAEGEPWILEINANPSLAPDAGFAAAASQAGLAYHDLIGRIVAAACGPGGRCRRLVPAEFTQWPCG